MNNQEVFLEGELVYLRAPNIQKDVIDGPWTGWFNDDHITRYLIHGVYPNTLDQQIKHVEGMLNRKDVVLLSIVSKKNDQLCGIISLKDICYLNRIAEMTIVMDNRIFEKGSSLEAWALMTQYGFDRLNLNKINAGHHEALWKWVNKTELLGYKLEGYRESIQLKNDSIASNILIGITRDSFYALLKSRNFQYIPNQDVISLLNKVRKDNICEKLKNSIASLYTDES